MPAGTGLQAAGRVAHCADVRRAASEAGAGSTLSWVARPRLPVVDPVKAKHAAGADAGPGVGVGLYTPGELSAPYVETGGRYRIWLKASSGASCACT